MKSIAAAMIFLPLFLARAYAQDNRATNETARSSARPPSYNLAQVMEQIEAQKRSVHNSGHPSD